jgi:DNA-binding CsgD family transcriptional regulator/PAS domain-containing protein
MEKKIGLFSRENLSTRKNQYTDFEPEVDQETIIEQLKFAEQLFPQNLFVLCPVSHRTIRYVSRSCNSIVGFTDDEITQKSMEEFLHLIHPDDLQGFMKCLDFIESKEPLDPLQHRILVYYRIRHKSGHYLSICDEKLALKTSTGKYVYMSILRDISNEIKFNTVHVDILKQNKNGYSKIYSYKPQSGTFTITPRQSDVILMTERGFSNKEIAEKLHVSISTVKNHKQAVFRKVNVRTSVELASVMREQSAA